MKVIFGDLEKETLKNGGWKCLSEAEYVDSSILNTVSKPRNNVIDKSTGEPKDYKKIPVEVAIKNDDFSNNKVSIFYYKDPENIKYIDSHLVKLYI